MYNTKFYQAIGHAFYAVAHADKKVSNEELSALVKIVKEYWAPLEEEKDEFGEDIAFQIIAVFDWLSEKDVKDKEALNRFKDYVEEHTKLFTSHLVNKIIKTCEKIAEVSHGINKKENKIIKEIKQILSQHSTSIV